MSQNAANHTRGSSALLSLLERAADSKSGVTFVDDVDAERVTWRQLHEDARRCSYALREAGIGLGSRVAIVGPSTREIITAIQATWLSGASLTVIAAPARSRTWQQFSVELGARVQAAAPDLVVVDESMAEALTGTSGPPLERVRAFHARAIATCPDAIPTEIPSDAIATVQYTSGSTTAPKGVVISHAQLAHHIQAAAQAAGFVTDNEIFMSWLPLFHDMGLVGFLCVPMMIGLDLVLADTTEFLQSPSSWMERVSSCGATVTGAPGFAYGLAARTLRTQRQLDLSRLRLAVNGAEPIDPSVVEAFVHAGARHRLDAGAVFCVYGLAEATLAVSFPTPGTGLQLDTVDEFSLEWLREARPVVRGRRLVKVGSPIGGMEIRIVDPDTRNVVSDRVVGEIEIRGRSVTAGYLGQPVETARAFHDDWLRTGDLGYVVDGDLVVCGRLKDVIIIAGRNIHPQDIERAVSSLPGIRTGNVIAFPCKHGDREGVVVVAERRDNTAERHEVTLAVRDAVGVAPADVALVPPGSLPKTSSGKLQRAACRSLYESGDLERFG